MRGSVTLGALFPHFSIKMLSPDEVPVMPDGVDRETGTVMARFGRDSGGISAKSYIGNSHLPARIWLFVAKQLQF